MIRVITDSTASIPSKLPEYKDLSVLSLFVNHNGVEQRETDMDLDEFYKDIHSMVDNIPTSSQPSQHDVETVFEEAAKAGDQVLGAFVSSGMSGTYEGAVRAARAVQSRNPDFKYSLVDTTSNCFDEAYPVLDGLEAAQSGKSLEECTQAVLHAMQSTRFLFTPETLAFLKAGGRIGHAAALLGGLMQMAPVLTVRNEEAATFAKVRSRKKALDKIMRAFKEDTDKHGLKRVMVHYIGSAEPALEWARDVVEPEVGHKVDVFPASPVIGVHVGPAVGMVYECNEPIEGKIEGPVDGYVCTH